MAPKYNQSNERPAEPGDNQSMPLDPQARGAQFQRMEVSVNVRAAGAQTTTRPVDTPERNASPNKLA